MVVQFKIKQKTKQENRSKEESPVNERKLEKLSDAPLATRSAIAEPTTDLNAVISYLFLLLTTPPLINPIRFEQEAPNSTSCDLTNPKLETYKSTGDRSEYTKNYNMG